MTRIAESLATRHAVKVLCSQPTYSSRGLLAPIREERNRVAIERCRSTRFNKDVLPLRLTNVATICSSIFLKTLFRVGPQDHVLVATNPPLLPFFVVCASWLRRAKVVLLVQDVYPDALIATRMIKPESPLVRMGIALYRRLYRRTERIVVLGRDMQALVASRLDGGQDKIVLIPNWGDVDFVRPAPRADNALLERLGVSEKFVVQYMGNMGRTHGIEALAAAAVELQTVEDIHFLCVGWGARKSWLEKTVAERSLCNVTVLPGCPREELPDFLNACDLSIIAFVQGMRGVSVPSRMYNVLAAGKPILAVADHDSELAMVVKEERIGWVVSPDRPNEMTAAIREARASRKELVEMGKRARDAAERQYSFRRVSELYAQMISDIDASAGD